MKRILKRMGRWLGLIERRWWDDLDCSPVVVVGEQMLAAALERLPAYHGVRGTSCASREDAHRAVRWILRLINAGVYQDYERR